MLHHSMAPCDKLSACRGGNTWPRLQAVMPLDRGSAMAPSSCDTLSGSLKQKSAGWSMKSAREPCIGGVAKNLMSGQRL